MAHAGDSQKAFCGVAKKDRTLRLATARGYTPLRKRAPDFTFAQREGSGSRSSTHGGYGGPRTTWKSENISKVASNLILSQGAAQARLPNCAPARAATISHCETPRHPATGPMRRSHHLSRSAVCRALLRKQMFALDLEKKRHTSTIVLR